MSDSAGVQGLAREAASWFEVARRATGDTETGPREDGERYVRTRDGRPEWVQDLAFAAHGEFLPDDWRYATISAALEFISESGDPEEDSSEFADGAVDIYTGALLTWLSSNLTRVSYCDEAASEFGGEGGPDIVSAIGLGQYYEAAEVYGLVLQFLEARVDEFADSEEVAS